MEFNSKQEYLEYITSLDLTELPKEAVDEITTFLENEAISMAQESFYHYVLLLGPTRIDGFQTGRHIEKICKELQDLGERIWLKTGLTPRKMISLPPGGMKSELCSRLFPSWLLGRWPKIRMILVGHGIEFAKDEFGAKIRDIVRSEEYKAIFPLTELREDKQTAGRFLTKTGGEMVCTSLEAKIAGRRGHIVICDDALVEDDALSKPIRMRMVGQYMPNVRSRLLMSPDCAELQVGTRWTQGDLFDYLEEEDRKSGSPWEIIKIPALLDEEASEYLREEGDPEGYLTEGTSFWPEFHPTNRLEMLRASYVNNMPRWNAVYMQALEVNTLVPTPTGWATIQELKIGDYVIGSDGSPTKVINKTPVYENRKGYEVKTNDGYSVKVDEDHLWSVKVHRADEPWSVRDTKYLARRFPEGASKHPRIPVSKRWELPEKDLGIDPYIFGLWLGDGDKNRPVFTAETKDQNFYFKEIESRGYPVSKHKAEYSFTVLGKFRNELAELGVLNNKHVPEIFFRASAKQRLELLQGLMDTDGTVQRGQSSFANTNLRLINAVQQLVLSLGGKPFTTSFTSKKGLECYKVSFYLEDGFKLPRKEKLARKAKTKHFRFLSFKPIDNIKTQCITVEAEDNLFLVGKGCLVTHNCPTPEQGQLINPEDFKHWKDATPPECHTIIVTADTAYTKGTQSDFSAYQVWGLFNYQDHSIPESMYKTHAILLNAKKGKWDYPELTQLFMDIYRNDQPDYFILEERSSGLALVPDLQKRGLPVYGWKTEKDKIMRMQAGAPLVKSGIIWVPMPADDPNACTKATDFVTEICTFPGGNHDDVADAFSQFLLFCRDNNVLTDQDYTYQEVEEDDDGDDFYVGASYTSAYLGR